MFISETVYYLLFILLHYRNEFYFCGFYQCVNSGESLTNLVKPKASVKGLYVKFVSDSMGVYTSIKSSEMIIHSL